MIVQEIVGFSCVAHSGRIITHPAIQNNSGATLAAGKTFRNWFPYDSRNVRRPFRRDDAGKRPDGFAVPGQNPVIWCVDN
jgi:hypothetical protein